MREVINICLNTFKTTGRLDTLKKKLIEVMKLISYKQF